MHYSSEGEKSEVKREESRKFFIPNVIFHLVGTANFFLESGIFGGQVKFCATRMGRSFSSGTTLIQI
jgi:hypothetical protein